jgi:membrane protein
VTAEGRASTTRTFPIVAAASRFFVGRGTHLAAMVAYFALASFVPLIFLALAGLGLSGQLSASSALVGYLQHVFPGQSVDQIVSVVRTVQGNAKTLTIIGSIGLLWSSVSLFSSLESAFNIIYGRPNRSFLRGKAIAVLFMGAALLILFVGLIIGTFGYDLLRRYASAIFGNSGVAIALTVLLSAFALFLFLVSAYHRLTNARLTVRELIPGAIIGAVLLELTLQSLPLFVYVTGDVVTLQVLGTTFLLLVWLYLMANVIVFGAAYNFELTYGRTGRSVTPRHVEASSPHDRELPRRPLPPGGETETTRSDTGK